MAVVESLTLRRVQRHTLPDGRRLPPMETTEYIQADRKREEHRGFFGYRLHPTGRDIYRPGPRTALIKRCDLQKAFLVNFDDREYTACPIQAFATREEIRAGAEAVPSRPSRRAHRPRRNGNGRYWRTERTVRPTGSPCHHEEARYSADWIEVPGESDSYRRLVHRPRHKPVLRSVAVVVWIGSRIPDHSYQEPSA